MKPVTAQKRKFNQFNTNPDVLYEKQQDRSMFDLSHDHKLTMSMGQLIPFATYETLPGDTFEIGEEVFMRFAPLYLPIMHQVNMTIHYFYVPNRIVWPEPSGWASFIMQKEVLEMPFIDHPTHQSDEVLGIPQPDFFIATYMGFPANLGTPPPGVLTYQINAMPIAAYVKIFDEYYRNPRIQEELFVPLEAGDNSINYNVININWTTGFDTSKLSVRRKLWNRDYFTSATPTPQYGEDIQVPLMTTTDVEGIDTEGPRRWRNVSTDAPEPGSPFTSVGPGLTQIDGENVYLDIQETAPSIRTFRLAARMLEYMEKMMRTAGFGRYSDFIRGWFGTDPDKGVIQQPEFLGGSVGRVMISEVMSTAETVDALDQITSPLGAYAGQALLMEKGGKLRYFCPEHGFIIGIICVTPRTSYMQGIPKFMLTKTPLAFAWEQFAETGDQAITRKEINVDWDTPGTEDDTFGYIPRYSEYRWVNDVISGEMRNLWESFHLGRIFQINSSTDPALNGRFITCQPRITDVFQLAGDQFHEIYAHIYNKCTVLRRLPKYGIPKL